jgi:hypothetical protein
MPQMRFEPTIPEFERAKTVLALDRGATVIGAGKRSKQIKNRKHVNIYVILHKYRVFRAQADWTLT